MNVGFKLFCIGFTLTLFLNRVAADYSMAGVAVMAVGCLLLIRNK